MQPNVAPAAGPGAPADEESTSERFLVYGLGGELYASHLTHVKEVIKLGSINPVPFMVAHFRGVLNLRGQIVSVIDLRAKFAITPAPGSQGLILVVEAGTHHIGAIVDDVVEVVAFEPGEISATPALQTRIPLAFFRGIARHQERLINLIDIAGCMSDEDFAAISRSKEALWKREA